MRDFSSPTRHANFPAAVLIWITFAVVIAVGTWMKDDVAVLRSGERVVARVSSAPDPAAVRLRTEQRDANGDRLVRDVPTLDVDEIQPRGERAVTPEYRRGARLWWDSRPIYTDGVHGFLYFPHGAIVYTPFVVLRSVAGGAISEVLWRLLSIGVYALAIWRLANVCLPVDMNRNGGPFLIASALGVFAAFGSAQNGQTNLVLGGLIALAAADAAGARWWRTTLWLFIALAFKPIAIVPILLFGAVYARQLVPRLSIGLIIFLAVPFLHPSPSYVLDQYIACATKLASAAQPPDRFQDIRGMLMDFGLAPDSWTFSIAGRTLGVLTLVRAIAAIATLGVCLWASRRARFAAAPLAICVLTFATAYLMLFNPRTEGVSSPIVGPACAMLATLALVHRRWFAAVPLVVVCLLLQFSRVLSGGPNYWVRPMCMVGVLGYATVMVIRSRASAFADTKTNPSPAPPPPPS